MRYVFFICLFLAGCGSVGNNEPIGDKPKEKNGFFSSAKRWFVGKSDEEKQKEIQETIDKTRVSDDLLSAWVEKLNSKQSPNGGYIHHEGITEPDAWGNFIKVSYEQDGFFEKLSVTSLGPDGIINTGDDLVRTRSCQNATAFYKGFGVAGWFVFAWVVSIPLSLGVLSLKNYRIGKRRKHPIISTLIISLVAPIFLVGVCLSAIFSIFGAAVGVGEASFDFFEFASDFADLDFGD